MNLGELTLEFVLPLVGTTFEVTSVENQMSGTMKLDGALPYEVHRTRRVRGGAPVKRAPFSLFFVGSPDIIFPQGMYLFRSEALTLANLFIVPIGHDEEATEYEAVFS